LSEVASVLTAEFISFSICSWGEFQYFHLTFVRPVAETAINAIDGDAHPKRKGTKAQRREAFIHTPFAPFHTY
jgi:hypothetical protein